MPGERRSLLHEPIRKVRTNRPRQTTSTSAANPTGAASPTSAASPTGAVSPAKAVKTAPAAAARTHRRAAFLLALLALCAIGFIIERSGPQGRGALTLVEGSEVRRDAKGRIVQVSGPDPGRVLASFCLAYTGESLQPVRVIATSLQPGRLGIIRRSGEAELMAIRIREDRAAEKWVAGDGVTPLVLSPAPAVTDPEAETRNSSNPAS